MSSFLLNQFLPFICLRRQRENTILAPSSLTQGEFGSSIVKNATKNTFSSKGKKRDKNCLSRITFPLIQSCTKGSVSQVPFYKLLFPSDRTGEFLAPLKARWFSTSELHHPHLQVTPIGSLPLCEKIREPGTKAPTLGRVEGIGR